MGKSTFTVAQLFKALDRCAPGYRSRVTRHSILVHYSGKSHVLPKGIGGGEKPNRIPVADHCARQLVTLFELDVNCVEQHLPGLLH